MGDEKIVPDEAVITSADLGTEEPQKISLMKRFSPRPITERLRATFAFFYDERKRFFVYNRPQGLWRENAEELIEAELRDKIFGEEMMKRFFISEVVADVRGLSYHARPLPEEADNFVPFSNGVYNLGPSTEKERFLPFSPFRFFTSKLAVDYNTDTHCPTIDAIFQEIAPQQVEDLYDLVALCLFRGYPVHKFFVLYGPGRNGKSVFAQILTRVLGRENVATVSLADIENSRFATSALYGKFANIGPEQAYDALVHTSRLKQLSGGDLVFAERKFGHPFNFTNHAKLIFLTNELPPTSDKTKAFYSRVKIITFPNVFEGEAADRRLVDGITVDEFDGLAAKCLRRLQDFFDHGFNNVLHESSEAVQELYERLTDPLTTFLKERTEDDINAAVPKWQLTEDFAAWCGEKGFRLWTEHRLGKEMGRRGYDTEQRTFDEGKVWRAWMGLKWKNGGPQKRCEECSLFGAEGCEVKEGARADGVACEKFNLIEIPASNETPLEGSFEVVA